MIVSRVVSLVVVVVVVVGGLFPASRTRRLVGLGLSALGSRLSIRTRLLAVASSPESVGPRAAPSWWLWWWWKSVAALCYMIRLL